MLNPFLLMAVFYLLMTVLVAADAALVGFTLLPWFAGLPWLRVHFITLGVMAETAFGVLPMLAAARNGREQGSTRWDIWLLLNAGLILLFAGIPSVTSTLIIAGGTLVFLAALLLLQQLYGLGTRLQVPQSGSLKFYLAGLAYLLVGILIGTGLWVGWSEPLRISVPKEAHVHANSWGFASLVFAGLLVDLIPGLTGAPLASRRSINLIFWSMTVGALGLVAGPWLNALAATVPGLALHILATVWLLAVLVGSLRRFGLFRRAGSWHVVLSYTWLMLPVLVSPLVILRVPAFPGADVEATAPQALIYGWMLQFSYAVVPYFVARLWSPGKSARLGGNWWSLLLVNSGSALIWLSIFLVDYRAMLQGAAYVLLGSSLLIVGWQTAAATLAALRQSEQASIAPDRELAPDNVRRQSDEQPGHGRSPVAAGSLEG